MPPPGGSIHHTSVLFLFPVELLDLKKGANQVQFSVTSAFQGTTKCFCQIFLWHHSDKIVISDIDGTITKSDVRGHIYHMIGRDWSQCDVVKLFRKIAENGYHIVYLSARAIGKNFNPITIISFWKKISI